MSREPSDSPNNIKQRAKYHSRRLTQTFHVYNSVDKNSKVAARHFRTMHTRDMQMNSLARIEAAEEQTMLAKKRQKNHGLLDECACGAKKKKSFKTCWPCYEKKRLADLQEGAIEKVDGESTTANFGRGITSPHGFSTPASVPGSSAFIARLRAVALKRSRTPVPEGLAASHKPQRTVVAPSCNYASKVS